MGAVFLDQDNHLRNYLFTRHILVNDTGEKSEYCFETRYALAYFLNIRITAGADLASPEMIAYASSQIGTNVPAPFYRGFPATVRTLSQDELLFDQLLHYFQTYTLGDFSEARHSVMEAQFQRTALRDKGTVKDFEIITASAAVELLREAVDDLLTSTRPLNNAQYGVVCQFVKLYNYDIPHCGCKDTAIRLLLNARNLSPVKFLNLSDVIRLVDYMVYDTYNSEGSIRRLNLRNQDRKLIAAVLDRIFIDGKVNTRECFEKQALWQGLLHHIHYKPVNRRAAKFMDAMRNGKNDSVHAEFERKMAQQDIPGAAACLARGKGSGAVLRHLNRLLARCSTPEEVSAVLACAETKNPIILIQLLMQYQCYQDGGARHFLFNRFNTLRVHRETAEEMTHRHTLLPRNTRDMAVNILMENLRSIYRGKLGKVYVDEAARLLALPLQEGTSMGGFGVLPKGSRISLEEGDHIRCFTYWEQVDDIDLAAIALNRDGTQQEFSWRTMSWSGRQSREICFSGDQTSGFRGGSEFFDLDLPKFREKYPEARYLVFCDSVFSGKYYSKILCTAGYMIRQDMNSGEVFEPKTVASSFRITCDSTSAILFGVDLDQGEIVWLNLAKSGSDAVIGEMELGYLDGYFHITELINVYELFAMMATELVDDPMEADVVVTDQDVQIKEGAQRIRSFDFDKILAYMNQ